MCFIEQEGLNIALEKMKTDLPWKEYLDMSVKVGEIPDAQDDIKRELALYYSLFSPLLLVTKLQ